MKSIGFPLSVSRLRKSQLQALQAPMTAITLNRLGYPKSLSRTVVFGSRFYGGLEFGHLATVQGSEKLVMFIRHLRTSGQPHDFSLIVLEHLQHQAGGGYPLLEFPKPELPYLEGIWFPTVRSYLSEISGSLRIAQARLQPLARCDDQYIMDMILQSNLFSPHELKFLNYCRLYLQVLTLSDIINAQGNDVRECRETPQNGFAGAVVRVGGSIGHRRNQEKKIFQWRRSLLFPDISVVLLDIRPDKTETAFLELFLL
jgi:hypothetical protein